MVQRDTERVLVRERERVVDVPHTTTQCLRERHQFLKVTRLAADEVDQDDWVLGVQDNVGHRSEGLGVSSHRCRCLLHVLRRHLQIFAGELLFLEPGVVAHIDWASGFRDHRAVGTHETLGDTLYRVRLVVPLGVVPHRLSLHQRGV